jgi:hypothetical protein
MLSIQNIDDLWELYINKNFEKILEIFKDKNIHDINDNLKELYYLSLIEQEAKIKIPETKGIFKELLSAMYDYHNQNYIYSSKKLSNWLLNKNFYSDWIVDRFFLSAKKSHQYNHIIKVCEYFIKKGKLQTKFIKEIFYAFYELKEYSEALKYFEVYRELFDDSDLQIIGIILIKQRRFKEAERILLSVYKNITGKEYQLEYEKYEKYYKNKYKELKEKFLANQINDDKELSEYAMACLFNGEYRVALQLFTQLKNKLEKAA